MTPEQLSLIESARAEELKTHAVEFLADVGKRGYLLNSDTGKWYNVNTPDYDDNELTEIELYNLFNPKA